MNPAGSNAEVPFTATAASAFASDSPLTTLRESVEAADTAVELRFAQDPLVEGAGLFAVTDSDRRVREGLPVATPLMVEARAVRAPVSTLA
jgi:hypothetical protein